MRPALLLPIVFALCGASLGCASKERKQPATQSAEVKTAAAQSAKREPAAPAALGSAAAPVKPVEPPGPRVYAKTRFVWVRPQASEDAGWIGYLWFGGSVKLKTGKPVPGPGCGKAFYELEPRGFVCVDDQRATLDAKDPVFQMVAKYAPKLDSAWPHNYAESRGVARYKSIPTREQQRRREWDLPEHQQRIQKALAGDVSDSLKGVDLKPAVGKPFLLEGLPSTLAEQRSRMTPLSTVAWSSEVFDGDRSWLLTADMMWVPKDRVAPYEHVTFHGVVLGKDASLPLAFFRGEDRVKYRKQSGGFVATDQKWARLSYVELTAESQESDGVTYLRTKDGEFWLNQKDAVLPTPQEQTPWGAAVNGPDNDQSPPGRKTWMEASVWKGWLIAYHGTKPVYATMISPGRGGTPEPGKSALSTASTPTGTFKITGKFATATMVAPFDFIHSDVPWTQNFSGPHALHGAYWHDDWGNRMSAGCVNVSPIDGRYLFEFTEPDLPAGWHGVRWRPDSEPATSFVVHD